MRDLERASCLFVRGREEIGFLAAGAFAAALEVFAAIFGAGLGAIFGEGLAAGFVTILAEGFALDFAAGLEGFGRVGVELELGGRGRSEKVVCSC